MSIKSRLIIVITFLSILAAGIGMLGTLAAALFGYFLICHIYHDWVGELDETTGETGWRQSDRGRPGAVPWRPQLNISYSTFEHAPS
jgi:hypothetical protein